MEIACDDLLEGRGPDLSSEFQKLPDISQAQAEQMAQRAIGNAKIVRRTSRSIWAICSV